MWAVHLHSVWLAIHRTRGDQTADAIGVSMSPVKFMRAIQLAADVHKMDYTDWQIPDPSFMGWLERNYERARYQVHDLKSIKAHTNDPDDPLCYKADQQHQRYALTAAADGDKGAQFEPVDVHEGLTYLTWQRKMDLNLNGEHLNGLLIDPTGNWVGSRHTNIYRTHYGRHVIHAHPSKRLDWKIAKAADIKIRREWMKYVREGKSLGEAIELSITMMNIFMRSTDPIPREPSMSKAQIDQMLESKLAQRMKQLHLKGKGKGGNNQNGNNQTTNKNITKKGAKGKGKGKGADGGNKPACKLFNGAEGCSREHCRFIHFCTKCKKKNCTKGAANCTG